MYVHICTCTHVSMVVRIYTWFTPPTQIWFRKGFLFGMERRWLLQKYNERRMDILSRFKRVNLIVSRHMNRTAQYQLISHHMNRTIKDQLVSHHLILIISHHMNRTAQYQLVRHHMIRTILDQSVSQIVIQLLIIKETVKYEYQKTTTSPDMILLMQ